MSEEAPVIRKISYEREALDEFVGELQQAAATDIGDAAKTATYLLDYPTVYIVHNEAAGKYQVYIGETSDIRSRTIQHLNYDPRVREDWKAFSDSKTALMLIIGHRIFNKSLTLDIENRMMHYLTGAANISSLNNRRANPQNRYYTQEKFDSIFSEIWGQLRKHNKRVFPAEEVIKDSALFKASPFHKLSEEQLDAKRGVLENISQALLSPKSGQLFLVKGEAGAGKTVLLSSIFYELFQGKTTEEEPFDFQDLDAYLLVNHDEQLTVYEQIAQKLGLLRKGKKRVSRPTTFINNRSPEDKADVVLVDEAHLLWTQGKQSYRGKNQLFDLLDRAKVVVAIFDENQILATNQYWEKASIEELESRTTQVIQLRNQMRMDASPETVSWVRAVVDDQEINPILLGPEGRDENGYEIRVFEDPATLHEAIKNKQGSAVEAGLSRLLATFDWQYSSSKSEKTWSVEIGDDFSMPWNRELDRALSHDEKKSARGQSWAEKSHSINEVGSIYTIQGFDLNFAGVIIGPSVKYRGGRILFDPSASANKHATQRRTLLSGAKVSVGEELIRNQLNVLLTRGVHGLYIYAVDEQLQEALLAATHGGGRKEPL